MLSDLCHTPNQENFKTDYKAIQKTWNLSVQDQFSTMQMSTSKLGRKIPFIISREEQT